MKAKKKAKVHSINAVKAERTYELKVERLLNPKFSEALDKLSKMPMRFHDAQKAQRINTAIYHAAKDYIAKRTEVFEKYSERDEKGEVVYTTPEKTEYKVIEDKQADCMAELNALVEKTITVPVVNGQSAFSGTEVTAEFLTILDGIVTGA